MADKNYIEQVTNLERSTEKYVPKRMYDNLLSEYEEAERNNRDDLIEEHDLTQEIASRKDMANKEAVKLYTLDVQGGDKVTTTKRPINICPYCGDKMVLAWDDYRGSSTVGYRSIYSNRNRPADYVVFSCLMCGAKSPQVSLNLRMLDESIIAAEMGRVIDRAIWEKEHADDEDEEYRED